MSGILFFDIDGTLVDSANGQIQPSNLVKQAIQQAQQNGYLCFIASGRNYGGLKEYTHLGFDGYIFSDGAGIIIHNQEPILKPIPNDIVDQITHEVLEEYGGEVMLNCMNDMYASEKQYDEMVENAKEASKISKIPYQQLIQMYGMKHLEEYNQEDVLEIDISFPNETIEQQWCKQMNPHLEYVSTSESYGRGGITTGEATYQSVTKGSACKKVSEILGITNTYAFGDSMNDASMFEACEYSIAMGNADEQLKLKATYITSDVSQDGIVKAMQYYEVID